MESEELRTVIGAVISATLLSACSDVEYSMWGKDRVNAAGAHSLMDANTFEKVSLADALDPEDKRAKYHVQGNEIDLAFYAFYHAYDADHLPQRRNEIQDRLIAASNQRCSVYKNYLRRIESNTGFWLGSLTTVFGGVGAIVTDTDIARTFSGLAGISSGVSSEFTKNFFESVASNIITPGIDERRDEILGEIDKHREGSDQKPATIEQYTVERAIADAASYHGACSLNEGLAKAGDLVKQARNPPTLDVLDKTIKKFNEVGEEMLKVSKPKPENDLETNPEN